MDDETVAYDRIETADGRRRLADSSAEAPSTERPIFTSCNHRRYHSRLPPIQDSAEGRASRTSPMRPREPREVAAPLRRLSWATRRQSPRGPSPRSAPRWPPRAGAAGGPTDVDWTDIHTYTPTRASGETGSVQTAERSQVTGQRSQSTDYNTPPPVTKAVFAVR